MTKKEHYVEILRLGMQFGKGQIDGPTLDTMYETRLALIQMDEEMALAVAVKPQPTPIPILPPTVLTVPPDDKYLFGPATGR